MVDYMLSLSTGRPSSRLEYILIWGINHLRYRSPSNFLEKLQHSPPALNGVILMYQICYERIWFDIQHVYHIKNEWRYKYYDIKHTYFWYSLDSEDQKWHSDGADTQPRAPESRRLSLLVDCWLRSIICSIPSIHIHHIPSFQLRDQVTVCASIPRYELPARERALICSDVIRRYPSAT